MGFALAEVMTTVAAAAGGAAQNGKMAPGQDARVPLGERRRRPLSHRLELGTIVSRLTRMHSDRAVVERSPNRDQKGQGEP